MNHLNRQELTELMDKDFFYSLPCSITKWIYKLDLKLSEQVIFERIISSLLQNTRSKNSMTIRLSQSLISKLTNIKERTVKNSLPGLIAKGLLTKINTNEKGTLYCVNISIEAKNLINYRKKSKVKAEKYLEDGKNFEAEGDRDVIEERKDPVKKSVRNPLRNFLQTGEIDSTINTKKTKGISQGEKGKSFPWNFKPKASCPIPTHVKVEEKKLNSKEQKAALTRLKKLFNENVAEKVFNEIDWAMKFGWYAKKNWTNFYCVNHAIRLLKDKAWTTPFGYEEGVNNGWVG
mgnify:CR=1 FL=1